MATALPYAVNWETGADKLLIVSVGTGGVAMANSGLQAGNMNLIYNATSIPTALMNAASAGWDMACRTLGDCRHGARIDREYGDMVGPGAGGVPNSTVPKLFTYMRHDPDVSADGLKSLGLGDIDPKHVQTLDSVDYVPEIQRVGTAYAQQHVCIEQFAPFA
jgi:hypothetical protein